MSLYNDGLSLCGSVWVGIRAHSGRYESLLTVCDMDTEWDTVGGLHVNGPSMGTEWNTVWVQMDIADAV